MAERIQLRFGALSPPLHQQIGCAAELLEHQQYDADAIARLRVRSILTERETDAARRRLVKSISAAVER